MGLALRYKQGCVCGGSSKGARHAQFSDWEKWFISILIALGVKAAASVIITGMGLTEALSGPGMEITEEIRPGTLLTMKQRQSWFGMLGCWDDQFCTSVWDMG